MNPSSVLSTSITAKDGSGNTIAGTTIVAGNVSNKIFFYPSFTFPVMSTITITVSSTVRDLFGNPLSANYTFTFETGETLGPYLVSSTPSAQGFGVSVNASITLNFNKEILFADNSNIYLKEDTDETITGTYNVNGSQVVFIPFSPLKKKTRYRLYINSLVLDFIGNSAAPTSFSFTTEVPVQMALGDGFSCYLSSAGKVRCWGLNLRGQLGTGEDIFERTSALQSKEISFDEKILEITAGLNHACALFTSGRMKCWGDNSFGQLGTGDNLNIRDPAKVSYLIMPDLVKKISANYLNTCAILKTEKLVCWGNNKLETFIIHYGILGFGHTESFINNPMKKGTISITDKFSSISVGYNSFCGILKNGLVRCWGDGRFGQLGIEPYILNNNFIILYLDVLNGIGQYLYTYIADPYNLILKDATNSWGNMDYNLGAINQITIADQNSCALKGDYKVRCWGSRGFVIPFLDIWFGQQDDPNQPNYFPNQEYSAFTVFDHDLSSNVIHLSMKSQHICVVFDTGYIQCWGLNTRFQLGQGGEDYYFDTILNINLPKGYRPALLSGLPDHHARIDKMHLGEKAISIETAPTFSCAMFESGSFKCWGDNSFGQLGYGHKNTITNAKTQGSILSF